MLDKFLSTIDVQEYIFNYLPLLDQVSYSITCKRIYYIWKSFLKRKLKECTFEKSFIHYIEMAHDPLSKKLKLDRFIDYWICDIKYTFIGKVYYTNFSSLNKNQYYIIDNFEIVGTCNCSYYENYNFKVTGLFKNNKLFNLLSFYCERKKIGIDEKVKIKHVEHILFEKENIQIISISIIKERFMEDVNISIYNISSKIRSKINYILSFENYTENNIETLLKIYPVLNFESNKEILLSFISYLSSNKEIFKFKEFCSIDEKKIYRYKSDTITINHMTHKQLLDCSPHYNNFNELDNLKI